jgi:hypothetical protein
MYVLEVVKRLWTRGGGFSNKQSMLNGCIRCGNACTPLLLFYWFAFLLLYLTYVPDTGYQWAPLHVV